MNADTTEAVKQIATDSRVASRHLATASAAVKDRALLTMADELEDQIPRIIDANKEDRARGVESGLSDGLQDRLRLDETRIVGIAEALRELATLPDPVGEVVRGSTLENGLKLRQLRVPMGVVGMIYEARPNVTVDAAGIALKSGNAVILRGGSAALNSNIVLVEVLRGALEKVGLPADLIATIDPLGREGAVALMQARGLVDVLVPRGGAGLIQTVVREAQVPVIETGVGNCHVYVDAQVNQEQALAIVVNSKTHRDSVCNAAETLLVHKDVAEEFVPRATEALAERGVTIHGDRRVQALAPSSVSVVDVSDEDWAKEYLGPEMAVGVVDSLEAAIKHIQKWSSGHTDAICTTSISSADEFTGRVDSAVVNVNASTRFTDGGEFGLGAEIGISTQKLHARGPMGLSELTTTKWVVLGDGQIR
ncbi:glutamate-5-semialdehyde dehydrogenase [Actinomycetaceae bacterium MB13-C1-2]|nr:glutamate-5-semialdehyde dehydrogenase [Actinomycetaceae bacterium MB13-C1-2]